MTDQTVSPAVTGDATVADDDPVAAIMATYGPDILNRMNVDFEDSVLFVGRVLGGRPAATAARITTIDRRGVDVVVTDAEGEHPGRVVFSEEVTEVSALDKALLGLVAHAREVSGEAGTTSGEREYAKLAGIRTFVTRVVAVTDLSARCRQVTFGGGDLADFHVLGPDTFVYLLAPPPGCDELAIDQSFSWDDYWTMPDEVRPVGAYFTVRRWRPEAGEVDVWFVLHDHPEGAAGWIQRARPGDPVALWGPRTAWEPPDGTDWYLLVADDTGVPAVSCILEQLPEGTPVRAFVEVDNPGERQELPAGPGVEVTWLYRDGAVPGTATLLPDAVRDMAWPDHVTPYVWGGGESRLMTRVRKYVRHEVGLPREAVMLEAYWRRRDDGHEPR
jgi:NADPH-dependent ferric siderophore reductase